MLTNLLSMAESAGFKAAAKNGRLSCPSCGAKPITIPEAPDDVITCPQCDASASGLEWSTAASAQGLIGDADRVPAGTKISRQVDGAGATVWNIPASGRSGGLMLFAVVWSTITGLVSLAFLLGFLFGKPEAGSNAHLWFLIPFMGIFWVIGLGMFYVGCRNKFATHRLSVNRTSVVLRRELFGRGKEMTLPIESVQAIAQVEFYQQNYRPVRGIEIKGSGAKLRFGSILTEEEKAWLVADLKREVFGAAAPAVAPVRGGGHSRTRQSYFSIPLPKTGGSALAPGILLTTMGIGFVLIGIFVIGGQIHSSTNHEGASLIRTVESVFHLLDNGFRVIWTLISSVMTIVGVSLLIGSFRSRDQQIFIEASEAEVAFRTKRAGMVVEERTFPRSSVIDIRALVSGASNGKTMKRVELLAAGKAQPLSRWMEGEQADAFVTEVRGALF